MYGGDGEGELVGSAGGDRWHAWAGLHLISESARGDRHCSSLAFRMRKLSIVCLGVSNRCMRSCYACPFLLPCLGGVI